AGGCTIRYGSGLQDTPAISVSRVNEFVDKPRLTDTGFTDYGDDLAATRAGALKGLPPLLCFVGTVDKSRQATRSDRPQPRARRICTQELMLYDGRRQPLHKEGPEWLSRHVSFREPIRMARNEDGPRYRHLLHARSQMNRLTLGAIVHVQVAA